MVGLSSCQLPAAQQGIPKFLLIAALRLVKQIMKTKYRWVKLLLPAPIALAVFTLGLTQPLVSHAESAAVIPQALLEMTDSDATGLPTLTSRIGPDHDGDGIDSAVDNDDDDDRISDADEGLIDANGDGVPDAGSLDTDNDGIVDGLDSDSDNDGIPDWDEAVPHSSSGVFAPVDTDSDGQFDFRDLDSDNDGLKDLLEAGGTDADGDGLVDNFSDSTGKGIDDAIHASSLPVFDSDIDGDHDYRDLDSDNDGILDSTEAGPNPAAPIDTDGDNAANYRETDSDADGIPDSVEVINAQTPVDTDNDGMPDYADVDSDGDSLLDSVEAGPTPTSPIDTDNDGDPDYRDLDSNNDGTLDGAGSSGPATNGPDTDGDGIRNQEDLDDDNDGITDFDEGALDANNDGFLDAGSADADGDGTPDAWDLDSDNDGILDLWEGGTNLALMSSLDQVVNGAVDISFPVGSNGIADALETSPDSGVLITLPVADTDGDGNADFRDVDSDQDGIFDLIEAGGIDTDANGRIDGFSDSDGKGVDDNVQANALPIFDTDNNGTPDWRDTDSDSDGIPDAIEGGNAPNLPTDTDGDGAADYRETDSDNDTIPDAVEAGGNPGAPVDTDNDGAPDYQDLDSNNDGTPDSSATPTPASNGPDTDGDGIRNQDDLDDDNDGITDFDEGALDANNDGFLDAGSTDTDGDGTPDAWDLDSDNDGILDLWEGTTNLQLMASLDQVVNGAVDISFPVGSNGIPDALETSPDSGVLITLPVTDTDGDGTHDFRDLDSDGDGIFDLIEAGGTDSDGNGRIDNFVDSDGKGVDDGVQSNALPVFDTDGNGTPDWRDTDSDSDGLPDSVEGGNLPNLPTDTDGDGAADYRELDSDNDTILDSTEAGGSGTNPVDTDNDGFPDFQDTDSNNDGTPDNVSAPPANPNPQPASNGPDTDGDGIRNQDDLDDDNDGIPDTEEGAIDADGDGFLDASSLDTDGDGTPDAWDLDSDNDGILDNQEARLDLPFVQSLDQVVNGAIDIGVPVGSNGLADIIETSPDSGIINYSIVDTDGDGTRDFQDIDSDNDGINDLVEAGGGDLNNDGMIDGFVDNDDKGVDDFVQSNALPVFDTDSDGVADFRDLDSDNDTIPDAVEAGPVPNMPLDTDGDGAGDYREQDSDGDTIPDNVEAGNNPLAPVDTDNDGAPDFQDVDSDNNSIPDNQEPTAVVPNPPSSPDMDGDGVTNDIDIDDDNDGILDVDEGPGDADFDGVANQFDLESDNDGLFDIQEANLALSHAISLDANGDGIVDGNSFGPNGFADVLEDAPESGNPIYVLADADVDGVPDFLDVDSDNDSIYDSLESGHPDANVDGRIDFSGSVTNSGVVAGVAGGPYIDTDGDGVVDFRDLDSDNDGIVDLIEATGSDIDGNGRIDGFTDSNSDGGDDVQAQNPVIPPDQDGDRIHDFRDLDSDNDGLSDLMETAGPGNDVDSNGEIDNFTDGNGDGLDDVVASQPLIPIDTDGDAFADHLDLDSDNDGLFDLVETNGTDVNQDGVIDTMTDTDNDGIPDVVDVDQTNGVDSDGDSIDDSADASIVGGPDTDGDGILDDADPDADGDGFAGIVDDGAVSNQSFPDSDGDGILDFQEVEGSVNPNSGASSAIVQTGLSGTGFGCAIGLASLSGTASGIDPLLPLLVILSMITLLFRRFRHASAARRNVPSSSPPSSTTINGKTVAVAVATAVLLSGCGAFDFSGSDSSSDFKRRIYLGAGAGVTRLEPDATRVPGVSVEETDTRYPGVSVEETASSGGQLTLGMDLSNRFSVELHGGDLGAAEMSPGGEIGYQVGGLSGVVYAINDEYDRGRREGFNLFGRLGVGSMKNQAEVVSFERVNDFHLLAGIGLEYGFNFGLGVRAELVSFDEDAQLAQLGLVYRFGDAGDSRPAPRVAPAPEPLPAPAPTAAPVPLPVPSAPADSDNDGVPNAVDDCPTTLVGTPVDNQGCALFNGVIEGVNFEPGSAQLTADAIDILEGVAQTLQAYPDVRVTVEAHTDNQGSASSNLELSKQRAISVAKFLVERGVGGNRLQPQAFGESKPRASNATAEGRRLNRRVELNTL